MPHAWTRAPRSFMLSAMTEAQQQVGRNGLAIGSLVAGIVALVVILLVAISQLSGLLAVAGIVLGILALRRWRRLGGHVMAHFGLWLSVAALLLTWVVSFSRAFA